MLLRHMLATAILLTSFAVAGTAIVALTRHSTDSIIQQNQRRELLRTLNEVVPPRLYDNDPVTDVIQVTDRPLLGSRRPITVYRARRAGEPVAVMMTPVAPDGYNGDIGLLVAIDCRTENLLGVRVLWHKETPGLGDWIETERSDWVRSFTGHSLTDPDELGWRVEKDGGIFDQVTGATITPRAIVKAVYNTLQYYDQHREALLRHAPDVPTQTHDAGAGAPARQMQ